MIIGRRVRKCILGSHPLWKPASVFGPPVSSVVTTVITNWRLPVLLTWNTIPVDLCREFLWDEGRRFFFYASRWESFLRGEDGRGIWFSGENSQFPIQELVSVTCMDHE